MLIGVGIRGCSEWGLSRSLVMMSISLFSICCCRFLMTIRFVVVSGRGVFWLVKVVVSLVDMV